MTNKSAIKALLGVVLSEVPAFDQDRYLTSAFLESSQAVGEPSQLYREEPLGRRCHLPPQLRSDGELPPWETELLTQMFVGRPLIVVQGGEGCGKTSTLAFLRRYCRDLYWTAGGGFGYRQALLVIDLIDMPDDLKQKEGSAGRRRSQSAGFFSRLVNLIDSQLELTLTDEQVGVLFRQVFLEQKVNAEFVTNAARVRHLVGAWFTEHEVIAKLTWMTIRRALNCLDSENDKVIARLLLLRQLGAIQWREQQRLLVLALDNVDSFPEYLQSELVRTCETIAYGYATPSPSEWFVMVIFARFSTATRHSRALDGIAAHRVNFRAPDPAELVFFRLSSFLLSPKDATGWDQLEQGDRDEVLARAWFLWERLARPRSQFREVLSGLAGTNGRTGSRLAVYWLTSPLLNYGLATKEMSDGPIVSRALVFSLLLRVAHAVATCINTRDQPIAALNESAVDAWERQVRSQLFGNLLGIMVDNHVVRKKGARRRPMRDMRLRLSESTREYLRNLIVSSDWQHLGQRANAYLAEAVYDSAVSLRRSGSKRGELADILARALKAEEEIRRGLLERIEPDDVELARALCLWLCEGAVRGAGATSRRAAEGDLGEAFPDALRPFEKPPRPNSWEAIRILVSPDQQHGRTERSALNLFSSNGSTLSPVALHVLCYLEEEKEQGLQGVVLRERLRRWGFTDNEIMQTLMEMVEVNRRLIYCGVRDSTFELEEWFDTYHEVRITSAGSSYLTRVAATPAYLEWALLEPRELRERLGGTKADERLGTGSGRLELVLEGLKLVRADELARVDKALPHTVGVERSLSPFSWMFYGSLPRFVEDISAYKGADVKGIAAAFLTFAKDLRNELLRQFPILPASWEDNLVHAMQEYRNRFS